MAITIFKCILSLCMILHFVDAIHLDREKRQLVTCPGFPGYCSESYPGGVCTVVCAFGRPNVPECQPDGTWTDVPRCIEHEPGKEEQIPGVCPGIPGYCSLDLPGGVCEFDCLFGPDIRSFCTPDGTWDPYPVCEGDVRETRDGCKECPGPFGEARNRTAEAAGGGRRGGNNGSKNGNGNRNNGNRKQPTSAAARPARPATNNRRPQGPSQNAARPVNNRRNQNNNNRNNRKSAGGNNRNRPQQRRPQPASNNRRSAAASSNNSNRRSQNNNRNNGSSNNRRPSQNSLKTQPSRVKSQQNNNNNRAQNSNSKSSGGGGRCPGGALEMCIDVCPSFSARIFGACVSGCAKRCPAKK